MEAPAHPSPARPRAGLHPVFLQEKAYSYRKPAASSPASGECSSDACDGSIFALPAGNNYFFMTPTAGCPSFVASVIPAWTNSDYTTFNISGAVLPGASTVSALPSATSTALLGVITGGLVDLLAAASVVSSVTGPPIDGDTSCRAVSFIAPAKPVPLAPNPPGAGAFGGMTLVAADGCSAMLGDPCISAPWVYASDAYGNMAGFSTANSGSCLR